MGLERVPPRVAVAACLLASFALGLSVVREAPWEDEFLALRAVDGLGGYRMIPLYYLYLRAGHALGADFAWLRIWSFLPWLVGLWWCHGLLVQLRASREVALITVALLAVNPFLVPECMCIRYYAMFFATSVLAMRAAVYLVDAPRGVWGTAVAFAALLLPQLTIYSAAALLLVLVGWALRRRPPRRAPWPWLVAGLLVLTGTLFALDPLFVRIRVHYEHLAESLPFDLGYPRERAGLQALAFQYQQLLGWHYTSWFLPPKITESAGLCAGALSLYWLARRANVRHRGMLAAVAFVPVAVWAIASLVNVVGTRYYLYAALPLALGMASLVCATRAGWVLLLPTVAAIAIAVHVPKNPPLHELATEVERRQIDAITVIPVWYTRTLERYFALRRLPVRVDPWSADAEQRMPRWIFRKDPDYNWSQGSRRRYAILDRGYREVASFASVKKHYFQAPRVIDRLYERR
jgi:hypothetical protein